MLLKLLSRVKVRGFVPLLLIIILAGEAKAQTTLPVDHFDFSTITSLKVGFVPFRVIITAKATNGTTARSFAGTVQLTAVDAGGSVPLETQTPLQFASGLWVGIITVKNRSLSPLASLFLDQARQVVSEIQRA